MWVGEGGFQAPAPEELIPRAMGLWKYTARGQQIPQTEITAIRQSIPAYDANASVGFKKSLKNYKRQTRQAIGQMALSGKFDIDGVNLGIMIMEVVFGRKDAHLLSMTIEITQAMNFTLGGYNLKEQTALALRAYAWLVEMRGHNSEEEIARRRRVEELLEDLVIFLIEKREENRELIMNARQQLRMTKNTRQELWGALLKEPPVEVLINEILLLDLRISEVWRFLKSSPSNELSEFVETHRQIKAFEKALAKLDRRLARRRATEEEKEWKEETEKQLASLRGRSDFLWSTFNYSRVREVDSILSAQRELAIQGGVS